MQLPSISFTDISLLFAVAAIILLILAELTSQYYGSNQLIISNKKVKKAAIATSTLFLATFIIQIVGILAR